MRRALLGVIAPLRRFFVELFVLAELFVLTRLVVFRGEFILFIPR